VSLFGSDVKKSTSVTEITTAQDQRVQIGGSAGSIVSPGAAVAGGGAITAGAGSKITANISTSGLKGAEVQQMLDTAFRESAATRESLTGLASSLSSGLAAQGENLAGIVAATKAPEQTALVSLLPLALLFVLFLWSK